MLPVAFDQPDNAHRAQALGLARVIPFRKARARRLASELGLLLSGTSYAERAKAIANELSSVDGGACAADQLLHILDTRDKISRCHAAGNH
jgi:UDP:flavonoid glycosyltransferase YjiC (YdhE family)